MFIFIFILIFIFNVYINIYKRIPLNIPAVNTQRDRRSKPTKVEESKSNSNSTNLPETLNSMELSSSSSN